MNRKYSLKSNHEIEKLVRAKKSVGNKYYAIYYRHKDEEIPKIAISPTKRFKNAVERNYEKKVIKEILRENLPKLKHLMLLIVIKTPVRDLDFQEKKNQIKYLLKRIYKEQHV